MEQGRLADRVSSTPADESIIRLEQALVAASNAVRAGADGPGGPPPEHLIGALRCVRGLAEAERRRSGLLSGVWQELHGEQTQPTNSLGAAAHISGGFGAS